MCQNFNWIVFILWILWCQSKIFLIFFIDPWGYSNFCDPKNHFSRSSIQKGEFLANLLIVNMVCLYGYACFACLVLFFGFKDDGWLLHLNQMRQGKFEGGKGVVRDGGKKNLCRFWMDFFKLNQLEREGSKVLMWVLKLKEIITSELRHMKR